MSEKDEARIRITIKDQDGFEIVIKGPIDIPIEPVLRPGQRIKDITVVKEPKAKRNKSKKGEGR